MTKKTQGSRLKSTDIRKLNGPDLIKFTLSRDSLYRDYKLIHNLDKDRANEKIQLILEHTDLTELAKEFTICFKAANQTDQRQTYHFNLYVINLLELLHNEIDFSLRKREIEEEDVSYEAFPSISYDWVLSAQHLTPYDRYLAFELLVLGYSIENLAKRRHCTPRTIYNQIDAIVQSLEVDPLPGEGSD